MAFAQQLARRHTRAQGIVVMARLTCLVTPLTVPHAWRSRHVPRMMPLLRPQRQRSLALLQFQSTTAVACRLGCMLARRSIVATTPLITRSRGAMWLMVQAVPNPSRPLAMGAIGTIVPHMSPAQPLPPLQLQHVEKSQSTTARVCKLGCMLVKRSTAANTPLTMICLGATLTHFAPTPSRQVLMAATGTTVHHMSPPLPQPQQRAHNLCQSTTAHACRHGCMLGWRGIAVITPTTTSYPGVTLWRDLIAPKPSRRATKAAIGTTVHRMRPPLPQPQQRA